MLKPAQLYEKKLQEENIKAIEEVEDSARGGYIGISPLKYDNLLKGYLCLRPKEKLKMNYQDVKCFQQFALPWYRQCRHPPPAPRCRGFPSPYRRRTPR